MYRRTSPVDKSWVLVWVAEGCELELELDGGSHVVVRSLTVVVGGLVRFGRNQLD